MKEIEIKDISGKTRFSTPINKGAKGKFTLMKEDYIILPFSVSEPIPFKLGDYVDLSGVMDESLGGKLAKIYEIVDLQKPIYNNSTGGYDYQLRLDAYYWKWKNKIFKYTPESAGSEASWSLTAALDVHLGIVLRNLKALGYTYRGTEFTFSIDGTVENKAVAITYDNINILDALFTLASKDYYNCDCWITDNVIHFGRNEFGDAVKFERDVEAASVTRSESQGTYATRIFAFGSTKNIPTNYRPTDEQPVINGVVQKRLMLPVDTPFIDAYPDMYTEEAIEDVIVFDDIYPHRIGTMSDVNTVDRNIMEGQEVVGTFKAYQYKDLDLEFKEEYLIDTQELKIKFESGKLNGMEFSVQFNPNKAEPAEQLWEIVRNENYGRPLPDDTLRPENGDKYVLSGFNIQLVSDLYIPEAEQELKERALKYVEITKKDDGIYPVTLFSDFVFADQIKHNYEFGQRVNLIDKTYFENGRESRIIGWEVKLDIPWDSPVYTVGESMPYSRIGEIEDKIDALTYKGQTYVGGGGSGIYVIRTNDSTAPSDSNVFSALRSLASFLSKTKVDTTNYLIKLLGGVITDNIQSQNFIAGPLGLGHLIKTDPKTGRSYIEVDELYVRLKAYFDTLEIKHISHVGGTIVISPASMECTKVEIINSESGDPLYDILNSRLQDINSSELFAKLSARSVTEKIYRCYFNNTDGTKEIVNEFAVDDLVQCRTFNVKEGVSENVSNQYYWRRVVGVGENYIDLSSTDCDPISSEPQAGDTIVTIGNKTDTRRQNVIMLSAFGEGTPAIYQYQGINDYSLEGKAKTIISPNGNVFTGSFLLDTGEDLKEYVDEQGNVIKTEVTNTVLEVLPGQITLEVEKQISTVVDDVENIRTEVAALKVQSDEISLEVSAVETTANSALDKAEGAQSTANTVKSEVSSIKVQINNISLEVSSVESTANSAESTANSAYWKADSAEDTANSAYNKADSAEDVANSAITQISSLKVEVGGITSTVSKLEDGNELVSIINQTSTTIKLSAQKINLNGAISANGTFSISTAGYMECTGGTIGGFEIGESSLVCSDGSARLEITVSGFKFFRLNSPSDNAFMRLRADDDICLDVTSFGTNATSTGIKVLCNSVGYGKAIDSLGNVRLVARNGEWIIINGLSLNSRLVTSSTNVYTNDDIIIASSSSTITLYLSTATSPGKMIYVKRKGTGTVTVKGSIVNQDRNTTVSSLDITDYPPRLFFCHGSTWYEFSGRH